MIKANVHNFLFIVVIAALGFLAAKMLSRTALGKVPVVGSALNLVAAA